MAENCPKRSGSMDWQFSSLEPKKYRPIYIYVYISKYITVDYKSEKNEQNVCLLWFTVSDD